jgi:hypothetical protein
MIVDTDEPDASSCAHAIESAVRRVSAANFVEHKSRLFSGNRCDVRVVAGSSGDFLTPSPPAEKDYRSPRLVPAVLRRRRGPGTATEGVSYANWMAATIPPVVNVPVSGKGLSRKLKTEWGGSFKK